MKRHCLLCIGSRLERHHTVCSSLLIIVFLSLDNSLLLLINMIVAIIFKDWTNIPSHLAVLYFFGLVPGSLLAWMLPAYLAYKSVETLCHCLCTSTSACIAKRT